MREYAEDAFGPWDEAWQRDHFRRHFDPAQVQVIQVSGEDVGMMVVQQRTEEIFLADLEILPAYQGKGVGTAVLRELLDQASAAGKPVALQVLKVNIGARNLYQRLGFGVTGENESHYIMAFEQRAHP